MKHLPIIFLLIVILFLNSLPLRAFAISQSEFLDRLIDVSLSVSSIKNQVRELIDSLHSSSSLPLGDYLKYLFDEYKISIEEEDFLIPQEDIYLSFAKVLNIINSSYGSKQRISQKEAEEIKELFLSIKDKLLLDGLYGKIDMHEHYQYGGDIEEFLRVAGSLGISKILFVPTGLGPDNRGYTTHQKVLIKYIKKLYPEKVIAFCTIDEADPLASKVFEECLKDGGEGLKLIGGHPNFYDTPLNSENMYKVYQKAAEYKVPVLLHASIITIPQLKDQLEQVYSDFPDVTFIHSHYCSAIMQGLNLDQCAELLDKHPNLYIDLSMGGGIKRYHRYFKEDLAKVKDFILNYQDRILFGSDIILGKSSSKDFNWLYQRMRCDIDLHEQKEYTCVFGEENLIHQGLNLDKEILRKLYFENPKKALGF